MSSDRDSLSQFIAQYGSEQSGRDVPVGWRRRRNRKPGGCYAAAGRWSVYEPAVIYTEGLAQIHGVWFEHAWLTEPERGVIDLAWPSPGDRYFGVQIPDEVLAGRMSERGYWGPFLPELIAEGWTPKSIASRRQA